MNVFIMVVVNKHLPIHIYRRAPPCDEEIDGGEGTTRDGLKVEQQVFMMGITLCMYASR
jgi:hypothetical protein